MFACWSGNDSGFVYLSDFNASTVVLCESLVHCLYTCRSFSLLSTPSIFVKLACFSSFSCENHEVMV